MFYNSTPKVSDRTDISSLIIAYYTQRWSWETSKNVIIKCCIIQNNPNNKKNKKLFLKLQSLFQNVNLFYIIMNCDC